jgi:hypothetical protein
MGGGLIIEYRDLAECQAVLDDYREAKPGFSTSHALCIEENDARFKGNARYGGK